MVGTFILICSSAGRVGTIKERVAVVTRIERDDDKMRLIAITRCKLVIEDQWMANLLHTMIIDIS